VFSARNIWNQVASFAGFAVILLFAVDANAYVGPGAGLTVIGSVLAVGAAILLAIVGFVWYPVRRMMRARKAAKSDAVQTEDEAPKQG
jgi:nitrate reductase gamma subunit